MNFSTISSGVLTPVASLIWMKASSRVSARSPRSLFICGCVGVRVGVRVGVSWLVGGLVS